MGNASSSGSAGGSRHFWITVLVFAVANVGVWIGYHAYQQSSLKRDLLRVEAFEPGRDAVMAPPTASPPATTSAPGKEPAEPPNRTKLVWRFNLDAAPRAAGGDSRGELAPGSIEPVVAGQWTWSDARTLAFEPREGWPKATDFKVTLAPRLATPEGFTLGEPFAAHVRTPALKLETVRQAAFDQRDQLVLELGFSDAVNATEVAAHLVVRGPFIDDGHGGRELLTTHGAVPVGENSEGRLGMSSGAPTAQDMTRGTGLPPLGTAQTRGTPGGLGAAGHQVYSGIKFSLYGQNDGRVVRVMTEPLAALRNHGGEAWVGVDVGAGVTGRSGPLGLAEAVTQWVDISPRLMALGIEASANSSDDPSVEITFNNAVDVEKVRPLISVEPAVVMRIDSGGSDRLAITGPFVCGERYTFKIGKGPMGKDIEDGDRGYPRPTTLSVVVPDRAASVWMEHDEGYLGSAGNRTVVAHAVNVAGVKVRVTRMYENNLVAWRNVGGSRSWRYSAEQFAQVLGARHLKLAGKKNVAEEIRLNLDELLGKERARDGVYRVTLDPEEASKLSERDYAISDFDESETYKAVSTVVTLSDIGLTAKQTHNGIVAWAVSLSTGKPLAGVVVRVYSDKNQLLGEARTDGDGVAEMSPVVAAMGEKAAVLVARAAGDERAEHSSGTQPDFATGTGPPPLGTARTRGTLEKATEALLDDSARGLTWLDLGGEAWDLSGFATGGRAYFRQGFEAFIYTDRGVYRPGETVVLRAIVRGLDGKVPEAFPVRWTTLRPDGRLWKTQAVTLDADGAAEWRVEMPRDVPMGPWTARLGLPGAAGGGTGLGTVFGGAEFDVEEFVPERMKVGLALAGPGLGEAAVLATSPTTSPTVATAPAGGKAAMKIVGGGNVGRFVMGDQPLLGEVQADYLFGQPAANLAAKLVVRMDPARFGAEGWEAWTFGDDAGAADVWGAPTATGRRLEKNAALDANGHARFEMNLGEATEVNGNGETAAAGNAFAFHGPWAVLAVATVNEVGGRGVTTVERTEADELPFYVGMKAQRTGYGVPKTAWMMDVAVVKPGGAVAEEKRDFTATLYKESWNSTMVEERGHARYVSTRLLEEIKDAAAVKLDMVKGRGTCAVMMPAAGPYVLCVRDGVSGAFTTVGLYAISGGRDGWEDNISRENPERLEVRVVRTGDEDVDNENHDDEGTGPPPLRTARTRGTLNEIRFKEGEAVKVVVRSPFAGTLLLTVETDEVVKRFVVPMEHKAVEVPLVVPAGCHPNAYVTATVVRAVEADKPWVAHRAYGVVELPVDESDRQLQMEVAAPGELRPNNTLDVRVMVKDAQGEAVGNAAVSVAAVDEGICSLTGFVTPDPLTYFGAKRALSVSSVDLYDALMPEALRAEKTSAVGGGDEGDVRRHRSVVGAVRVRPVALVAAIGHTDESGAMEVHLQVPQFVGQLRVMAVGYAGNKFGSAAKAVLVRSPLMVQASWPRFAAPGDKFTVPLVVFNNTAAGGEAEVKLTLQDGDGGVRNPLRLADEAAREVTLPKLNVAAGGQGEMAVTLTAAETTGAAKVRLVAALNGEEYAEDVELPVRPASPMITRGDYAVVTPEKPLELNVPTDMLAGTERLRLRVTARPELHLPEGLDYLDQYPYGCAEQTISTLFPLVYLSDVGAQIAPGLFDKERTAHKVEVGITRLLGMQTADGGIAMWTGERESWPWASVYAGHFLVEAAAAGHEVPEDFRERLMGYLRAVVDKSPDEADVVETQAYACYVLALAGKAERPAMNRLREVLEAREKDGGLLAGEAQARFYLALAWMATNRRDLAAEMLPENLPTARVGRELGGNLGSPVRDQAMMLDTLLAVAPENAAIPALVEKLANEGRASDEGPPWASTQDTAFAVMALGRYYRQSKDELPYERAVLVRGEVELSSAEGGGKIFYEPKGGNAEAGAAASGKYRVRVTGKAGSKGYVAWTQDGVPRAAPADADHGLKVRRAYFDEVHHALRDGTVHSGDLVQVEVTVEAPSDLANVVVEDLLPAGLEVENGRFVSGAAAKEAATAGDAVAFGSEHVEVLDDRVVAMGTAPAGTCRFSYLARAVTTGTFVVPPVRAECMYDLGTNSISGGGGMLTVVAAERRAKKALPEVAGR